MCGITRRRLAGHARAEREGSAHRARPVITTKYTRKITPQMISLDDQIEPIAVDHETKSDLSDQYVQSSNSINQKEQTDLKLN